MLTSGAETLKDVLERAASDHPSAVAAVDGDRSLTYSELRTQAGQVAAALRQLGVGPDECVTILHDKSLGALVAIHGVLAAGAAYVPIDPDAPAARTKLIVSDAGSRVLISSRSKRQLIVDSLLRGTAVEAVILMDSETSEMASDVRWIGRDTWERPAPALPPVSLGPSNLAYVLYTSGSTGTPKGVMLTHENALVFALWACDEFRVQASDRVLSHAPFHFDLSVFDLFASALAGAAVVLVPPKKGLLPSAIVRILRDERVSIWYSVPSILILFLERISKLEDSCPNLRLVLFAGEVFPTPQLIRLMQALPRSVRFANLYGPTETNVCTWYEVSGIPTDPGQTIPIGRPISGVDVFAVTETREVAPVGEPGELWVRGPTVMRGYRNDVERTNQSLVVAPGSIGGGLAYRTGDICYQDPAGDWRYVGRRDLQVKHHGFRIDLGDIESALSTHPNIVECATAHVAGDGAASTLVVFVVTR